MQKYIKIFNFYIRRSRIESGIIYESLHGNSQSLSDFVAQNIGARKPDRARKALVYGMSASFGIGVFISYFFHGDILARIFSNDEQVILAADYFMYCFLKIYA